MVLPHIDDTSLLIGEQEVLTCLMVLADRDTCFEVYAPACSEQAVCTAVTTVVEALPADGQQGGQDEIKLFLTLSILAPVVLCTGLGSRRLPRLTRR